MRLPRRSLYPRTRRRPGESLLAYLCRLARTQGAHPRAVLSSRLWRRAAGIERKEVTPGLVERAVVEAYPHAAEYVARHNALVWRNEALGLTRIYYADWLKEGKKLPLTSKSRGVYCPNVHTNGRSIVKVTKSEILAVFTAIKFTRAAEWGSEKLKEKINGLPGLKTDPLVKKMDKKTRATFDKVVRAVETGEGVVVTPDPPPKNPKENADEKGQPTRRKPTDAPKGDREADEGDQAGDEEDADDFDDDPSDSDIDEMSDADDQEESVQGDGDEEGEDEAAEGRRTPPAKTIKKGKLKVKIAVKKSVPAKKADVAKKGGKPAAPAKKAERREPAGQDFCGSRIGSGASMMNLAIGPKPITKEQWEKAAKTEIRSPHVHKLVKVLGYVARTPDGKYHLTKKGVAAKAKA